MRPAFGSGVAVAAALALWLSVSLQGQTSGQSSGSSGRTTGGTSTGVSTSTSTGASRGTTTTQPSYQDFGNRPIYLSGKVVTDAGTPPPEPATLELVCGASIRPQGYTDSKGHFSLQLGQNQNVFLDASTGAMNETGRTPGMGSSSSGFGNSSTSMAGAAGSYGGSAITERTLMGCELRASLPGYRSEMISLAGRRVLDNPEVGTILLRRVSGAEGTVVSAASLAAPKDARKAYDKGREAGRKDKWQEAQKQFQKAVDVYPRYADAWYELGRCHQHAGNTPQARKSYGQALALDAKYMKPYLALSMLAAQESNWTEAADLSGKALKLDPVSYPEAYYLNAVANLRLNHLPEAEKAARQGTQADTAHRIPKLNHLLGMLLADKKEYPAAAEQIRLYLQFAPKATDATQVRKQLNEIEQFATAATPAPRP